MTEKRREARNLEEVREEAVKRLRYSGFGYIANVLQTAFIEFRARTAVRNDNALAYAVIAQREICLDETAMELSFVGLVDVIVHEATHLAEASNKSVRSLRELFDGVTERELRADAVELQVLEDWLEERLAVGDDSTVKDLREAIATTHEHRLEVLLHPQDLPLRLTAYNAETIETGLRQLQRSVQWENISRLAQAIRQVEAFRKSGAREQLLIVPHLR